MSSTDLAADVPLPGRLTLWPRRLFYLVAGIALLIAGQAAELSWKVTLALLLPLLAVELVCRALFNRRFPAFEGELRQRIQRGDDLAALLAFYRGAWPLRLLGPMWAMQSQLGLIYRHRGAHRAAAEAYREALEEVPGKQAFPVAVGLADSLFAVGELAEAERLYRAALAEHPLNSRGSANLSRAILARGGDPREAADYMRLALDGTDPAGALRLELAEQLLDLGQLEDARWELDKAAEELGETQKDRLEALEQRLSAAEKE